MKNNQNPDVYVKQEGYGDFKFLTVKAKEVANELKIPNSLHHFGKEFCGMPVYYHDQPKTHEKGKYTCGIKLAHIERTTKKLRKAGLVVESEFE